METEIPPVNIETKEKPVLGLEDITVTSHVFLPHFEEEGSSDQIRGDLAIEAITKAVSKGCKYSLVYNEGTPSSFLEKLKNTVVKELDSIGRHNDIDKFFILTKAEDENYSPTRQQAMKMGQKKFGTKVIVIQEPEKDMLEFYEDCLKKVENGAHIVLVKRGKMTETKEAPKNPNLPFDQFIFERFQDLYIDRREKEAGLLPKNIDPFDKLIGFRMIRNEEVETTKGKVNPLDLFMKLKVKYNDFDESEVWKEFTTQRYAQAVYFGLTIAESLGLKIASVTIPYIHDKNQTEKEMSEKERENWLKKRVKTARALIPQTFDMIANILIYQKESLWPKVLFDSLNNNTPLEIKHYDLKKYTIKNNQIVERTHKILI